MMPMKYKLAICDDDPQQLSHLAAMISVWSDATGHPCDIRTFPSAEAFLFAYEEDKVYDLLLLDIEMQGMSGIALAKQLRQEHRPVEIVFITSHFEFIGEGYEVDALHYLCKPVDQQKLMQVLSKAVQRLSVEPPFVILSCDGETVKVYEHEISYVEANLHYIVIHTSNKPYKIKENLSSFAKKLSDVFYQAHRSYLVSLHHITRISRTSVTVGNACLPLSRGKYDDIHRAFIQHN